jgi:hypothetical protein
VVDEVQDRDCKQREAFIKENSFCHLMTYSHTLQIGQNILSWLKLQMKEK